MIPAQVKNSTTTAYAASLVVSVTPKTRLCGLSGYNSLASTQFIQIHDAASLPADTSVPKIVFEVAASSKFAIDLNNNPRVFATGIAMCNRSTDATKTIGAADGWFDVQSMPGIR